MSDPTPAPAAQPTPAPTPAPATPPSDPPPSPAPTPAPAGDGTDWKAEARKWEKLAKDNKGAAEQLQQLEDAQKTEQQKIAEKLAEAEAKGSSAAADLLRIDVALAKAPEGMAPAKIRSLAGRLKGNTREELEADAKELFADFAGPAAPSADPQPAPGQSAPKPDPAQGSRGGAPSGRPTSLGQAVSAALAKPT